MGRLIILFTCLTLQTLYGGEKICINVYNGPGTSEEDVGETVQTLTSLLSKEYIISTTSPEEIIHQDWEERTALLVIPGGLDIPYTQALNGRGNQKIRNYVQNGGAFLGICAGSYYAGSYVDFARGTHMEVCGSRELAFFPGAVCGPHLADYVHQSEEGARAAEIHPTPELPFDPATHFYLYYNGGGYFVDAEKKPFIKTLAVYAESRQPAILECQIGKGIAILSGVHFEYNPCNLSLEDPYLIHLIPVLNQFNEERLELSKALLKRLKLKLQSS